MRTGKKKENNYAGMSWGTEKARKIEMCWETEKIRKIEKQLWWTGIEPATL